MPRHVGLALGVLSAAIIAACGQPSVPTTSAMQEEDHSEYATTALAAHSACENSAIRIAAASASQMHGAECMRSSGGVGSLDTENRRGPRWGNS